MKNITQEQSNDIEVVIFDLDDTLIPNAQYYKQTKDSLFDYMLKELPLPKEVTKEMLFKLFTDKDIENTKEYGLSRDRFIFTAVELYFYLAEKYSFKTDSKTCCQVQAITSTVFNYIDELNTEAESVLVSLKEKGTKIKILTSGDEVVQSYKIYQSNAYKHVDKKDIHIVNKKTPETYLTILNGRNIERCVMVGNSKKSDINPAIEAGLFAIHLDVESWSYEEAELNTSEKLYKINCISEVNNVLNTISNKI